MAFDPQREDYQRLGLRFARSLDATNPTEATRAFVTFGRRFARDRDSLPQSDGDRAFHLVAMASKLIDYELPFATDEEAETLIERGHRLLDEAVSLDARCHDAIRMSAAANNPSFESFFAFLGEHAEEVRRTCEEERNRAFADDLGDERAQLAADIAMRPYLRWIATQAEQALICGRNKEALRLARVALDADPRDGADARFTAAIACAKLEDEQGLNELLASAASRHRTRPANDAWSQLARIALAYKRYDIRAAEQLLGEVMHTYPHAAETLVRQMELPDGVFARLAVRPYSEDELVLAVSEATVLLQEGREATGRGVMGAWVAERAAATLPQAVLAMLTSQAQGVYGDQNGGTGASSSPGQWPPAGPDASPGPWPPAGPDASQNPDSPSPGPKGGAR